MTVPALNVSHARLPQTYEAAKQALAECSRIDECKDWADKAEALASYARQADDDTLRKMADRIQARAVRRAGELLKTYDGQGNNQHSKGALTKHDAAQGAGMSLHQERIATRVANVPQDAFDTAVESDSPPTVTALAEQGKKSRPLVDIGDRQPEEFAASTEGQGHLRRFAEFAERTDARIIAKGAMPHERAAIRKHIATVDHWLDQLAVHLED